MDVTLSTFAARDVKARVVVLAAGTLGNAAVAGTRVSATERLGGALPDGPDLWPWRTCSVPEARNGKATNSNGGG